MERALALEERLAALERRIESACRRVGRARSEITVIGVTKTHPFSAVENLAELGVRCVGENRAPELREKAHQWSVTHPSSDLQWHFIGQLQRNKAATVTLWADVVHTIDRVPLVSALTKACERYERSLDTFVQVNLDPAVSEHRGGVDPQRVLEIADAIALSPQLTLRGVMAIAPLHVPTAETFDRLWSVSQRVSEQHPAATWISAGMSSDLDIAVEKGATHLRVGSALLGKRA